MIYTTNAIEAEYRQFRKIEKTKGVFPTDDSLIKTLFLVTIDLKGTIRGKTEWAMIHGQLQLVFKDRIPEYAIKKINPQVWAKYLIFTLYFDYTSF